MAKKVGAGGEAVVAVRVIPRRGSAHQPRTGTTPRATYGKEIQVLKHSQTITAGPLLSTTTLR